MLKMRPSFCYFVESEAIYTIVVLLKVKPSYCYLVKSEALLAASLLKVTPSCCNPDVILCESEAISLLLFFCMQARAFVTFVLLS